MKSALVFAFHQLVADRSNHAGAPVVCRYILSTDHLDRILEKIPPAVCCTAAEFADKKEGRWLVLTIDDGFTSDYDVALPRLKAKGLKATFFVNTDNVGLPGYLSAARLREMADAGMEIGSHGLSHGHLTEMSREEVAREMVDSGIKLREMTGREVVSFAPAGGHYRKWMLNSAREAGYRVFATMVPARTLGNGSLLLMHRVHIQVQHDMPYVERLLNGDDSILNREAFKYHLLSIPKNLLGFQTYHRMRQMILKPKSPGKP